MPIAEAANNLLPSFVEIGLGGLIVVAAKKWGLREAYLMIALGVLGILTCIGVILLSGRSIAVIIQLAVVTGALVIWAHIFYGTWRDMRGTALAAPSKKDGQDATPFNPQQHRNEIEVAVFVKRKITAFDCVYTGIRNNNDFLEFCPKDNSESWLVQEIPDLDLTRQLRRQIGLVSTYVESQQKQLQKLVVILLIYRSLTLPEKASLMHQLETIKANDGLSAKLSFQVWDKDDL